MFPYTPYGPARLRSIAATVTPPELCQLDRLVLLVVVPKDDRKKKSHDIAEAYAVEVGEEIPGGCIIWGRYHGEWQANISGRWLVSQFIAGKIRVTDDRSV